jgi:hypothetical protein
MPKNTVSYWNPLDCKNGDKWEVVENTGGLVEQLTLAMDKSTGDYTRLTRFKPGADTAVFGAKNHKYPEEIMIIKGRIFDLAFNKWLETGDYASRPPGEAHGPFRTDVECIVLELSYPSQAVQS